MTRQRKPLVFTPPPGDQPTINVALIGPPKTGKTTGATSAPGPVLLVNADLPNASRYARRTHGEVQEVAFEGMDTLIDVTHEVMDPKTSFKTVVFDPMGDIHRRLMEEGSARALRPDIRVYADVAVHTERFCRSMCEAPINAVFVCHDLPVEDGDELTVLPFMGTTGKGGVALGRKLLGMVDVIGFTGVRWIEPENEDGIAAASYEAQLVPAKGRGAGDRFGGLLGAEGGVRPLDLTEWVDTIASAEKQSGRSGRPTNRQETEQ